MAASGGSSRLIYACIVAVPVLAVGGYFAFASFGAEADLTSGNADRVVQGLGEVDTEMFAEAESKDLRRQALGTLKQASFSEIMERMRSADLTEEQKARMRENMGQVFREGMKQNLEEFENASEEEKDAVLDRHIDEWVKLREEMQAYHEAHKDDPEYQKEQEERRAQWTAPTRQDRKKWMESGNPDEMARFIRYMGKMMTRAGQRGINPMGGRH